MVALLMLLADGFEILESPFICFVLAFVEYFANLWSLLVLGKSECGCGGWLKSRYGGRVGGLSIIVRNSDGELNRTFWEGRLH